MPRKRKTDTTDQSTKGGNKRGPGQPRKYATAEDFARVVEEYIKYHQEQCLDHVYVPSDFDFCKYAGIGVSTYYAYIADGDKYPGYSEAVKKLTAYREDFYANLSIMNPRAAGAAIFALKQRKNGGYEDKPTVQVEARELKIVHGDGMTDDSFK
jgi:hypothetical protein